METQTISRPRREAFDPAYDPIHARGPGTGKDYAPTYWIGTAGPEPEDDGPITKDVDVDVVVVGSGYTGLSCAIHLARDHGIKATVLEANGVAWGCSTRNGGQAQISAGRLKRSQWIERYGVDVAKKLHAEIAEGFDLFRSLIKEPEIQCDPQDGGHLYIAHRDKVLPALESEVRVLNDVFGYRARMVSREEVHSDFVRDAEARGAMYEPDGIGIHAAKLAFGYLRLARKLGAKVHTSSPVLECTVKNGVHYLRTPGGTVRARAVCFATAAYTAPGLNRLTKYRLMPILSNSIVTRPLSEDEQQALNFKARIPLTDTRTLRHYYRMLPDGRVQIGSRSAITGRGATNPKHLDLLLAGLYRKFPILRGIEVDYSWWGWVDVSHDMMPRIFQPDPAQKLYYAMGYGGNGVMYSAQAGRRMAQLVAGKGAGLDLPIFTSQLPGHGVLTPFRRLGQWWMYQWYYLKDEII
jgi:taurine dehydrogenase large subunit